MGLAHPILLDQPRSWTFHQMAKIDPRCHYHSPLFPCLSSTMALFRVAVLLACAMGYSMTHALPNGYPAIPMKVRKYQHKPCLP